MKQGALITLVVSVACMSSSAYALDPIPETPGWSGYLRFGGGVMDYKNNLIAGNSLVEVGQETIGSLADEPDSESTGLFPFNFEVGYTFPGSRSQITLGSGLSDIARLDLSQQLAFKHELSNETLVSLGVLFSAIGTDVWADPYVTGVPRQETDRTAPGVRLVVDRLFGSGLELSYSYRSIDIDEERSGEALGLSAEQRQLLQRDGADHRLELAYSFVFDAHHRLIPSVFLFAEDRDGDAMSNRGADLQMTYAFLDNAVSLVANALVGKSESDEDNPIFGKTLEYDRWAANMQINYRNPFGWKPFGQEHFSVWAAVSYLLQDATIDFYDTEVKSITAGVLVRF